MTSADPSAHERETPDMRQLEPGFGRLCAALTGLRTYETAAGTVSIGYVDNTTDWRLLRPYWDLLLKSTAGATIFASYTYMRTWWQQFAADGRPLIVVAVTEREVVGIAPMEISPMPWLGRKYRCLRLMGRVPQIDRPLALIPDGHNALADIMCRYLMTWKDAFDCVLLSDQRGNSALLTAMAEHLPAERFVVSIHDEPSCPCVDVSDSWEAYLGNRSRSQRKSVKRAINRLHASGAITVDVVDGSDDPDAALDRYLRIEDRSWKRDAGLGVGESDSSVAFHRALIREYAGDGVVALRFLRIDGKDVAATFGLLWNECYYSLHIAHDPTWDDYSPGFVLTALEIKEACYRDDHAWISFLGGAPKNNKRGWSTLAVPIKSLYAHPRSLVGRSFHAYHFHINPWLKSRLDRVGLLDFLLRMKERVGELRHRRA